MDTIFIVKDSADKPVTVRGRTYGRYRRVAVLEVDPATCPAGGLAMISDRARGVVRVVQTWERVHDGTTDRCAFARAMAEAKALCADLNRARANLPAVTQ